MVHTRSSHLRLAALCALLVACGAPPRPAAPTTSAATVEDPAFKPLTAFIASLGNATGEAHRFSGIVLVARGERVLYQRAFGVADRTTQAPITIDTSFRIGSVTKQFTAAGVLALEAKGLLAVGDPISKHLPDYPAPGNAITIHQLLTHTSGIPNFTSFPDFESVRDKPLTTAQVLALFADKPLDFAPGARFDYSNSNYLVLGAIIERVTKQPYATYMRDAVFAPAKLARTVVGDADELPDRAKGYQPSGDQLVEAPAISMTIPHAAGAVRSTARDLWTWSRALGTDRVLAAPARERLYHAERNNYAYGWMVKDVDGVRVVEHGGGIEGFLCALWRVPAQDLVVIVLANTTGSEPSRIAQAAGDIALGKPAPPPEAQGVALDPALAQRLAGRYALDDAGRALLAKAGLDDAKIDTVATIEVTAKQKSLGMKPIGQPSVDLLPTANGTFTAAQIGVTVKFELDPTGTTPAPSFTLSQGGIELTMRRIP